MQDQGTNDRSSPSRPPPAQGSFQLLSDHRKLGEPASSEEGLDAGQCLSRRSQDRIQEKQAPEASSRARTPGEGQCCCTTGDVDPTGTSEHSLGTQQQSWS